MLVEGASRVPASADLLVDGAAEVGCWCESRDAAGPDLDRSAILRISNTPRLPVLHVERAEARNGNSITIDQTGLYTQEKGFQGARRLRSSEVRA